MKIQINQSADQHRSPSLIDFLLGDGIHPGWLDQQSHHAFGRIALRCPAYSDDQSVTLTSRGVWHSNTEQGQFGIGFKRLQSQEAADTSKSIVRF